MFKRKKNVKPVQRRVQLDATWWGANRGAQTSGELFASADTLWPKLLLCLLMFMIFYLPNQTQINVETGIRGINLANILFVLTLAVMALCGRPPLAERTPLKLPLLLFIGVLTWAFLVALAGDSTAWVEDLTVYKNAVFYLLLYFLFFHAVRDLKTIRVLVLVLLFVVFTSCVLGVRQALDYGIGTYNENKRVAAPFGWAVFDANRAAIFFCIFLQLVGAGALFLKSRGWLRLACALTFAMGVFVVFHTYSRQSYFILAILLLLIAMRRHLLIAILAGVALLNYEVWVPETVVQRIEMTTVDGFETKASKPAQAGFDSAITNYQPIYGRMAELRNDDPFRFLSERVANAESDQSYDDSTESRFTLWAGAWELILQRPTGIGLNRFKREITPYVPSILAGKDAHNFYVLLATEAGLVTPVVLICLLASLLLLGQRLTRLPDDEEARMLGIGFVMATMAVALGNVYGSRFLDGDVMGNYWILAALVARALQLKEQERRDRQLSSQAKSSAVPPKSGLTPPRNGLPPSAALTGARR